MLYVAFFFRISHPGQDLRGEQRQRDRFQFHQQLDGDMFFNIGNPGNSGNVVHDGRPEALVLNEKGLFVAQNFPINKS